MLTVALFWLPWTAAASAQQTPTLERARALYDAGRLNDARALLEDLVRAQPGDAGAHLLLGVIERTTGHLSKAIASLERAHALEPDSTQAALELATTLAWHNDLDRAVELYQQVLAREPSNHGARVGLGFALAWQGHLEKAHAIFRELVGTDPRSVDAWNGLGFVDRAALRRGDSEADYRRALELDPQNKDAIAALKELHWDRRVDVRVFGGGSVAPDRSGEFEARADFTYALSPGTTIAGGYQRYAFGAVLPIGAVEPVAGVTEDSLEASVILRPSRRFTLGNSLYTFFSDETKRGMLWEEAVFAVTPRISLIGNFRPAFSDTDPHWLLAWAAGTTVSVTAGSRLGFRALVASDTEFEPRLTLLADYSASFSRRLQMQFSVAHSNSDEQFAFTSLGTTASWLMTPSVGLTVIASGRTETFERARVLVGVVVRR
jgi:cytochrome c-type biogenesis protein CcmH/NrfG